MEKILLIGAEYISETNKIGFFVFRSYVCLDFIDQGHDIFFVLNLRFQNLNGFVCVHSRKAVVWFYNGF